MPGIVLSTLSKSAISLNLHGAQAGTIDVIPNLKIMNLSPVFTLPSHIWLWEQSINLSKQVCGTQREKKKKLQHWSRRSTVFQQDWGSQSPQGKLRPAAMDTNIKLHVCNDLTSWWKVLTPTLKCAELHSFLVCFILFRWYKSRDIWRPLPRTKFLHKIFHARNIYRDNYFLLEGMNLLLFIFVFDLTQPFTHSWSPIMYLKPTGT